jgi:hypothetical protein
MTSGAVVFIVATILYLVLMLLKKNYKEVVHLHIKSKDQNQ